MITIETHKSLKDYNTFGIAVRAAYFTQVTSVSELQEALADSTTRKPIFVISGGSNMLLTQDLDAFVIHINIKGITIVEKKENTIIISANAGENWHEFVQYCIQNNYGGLENLSLIPGYVGSAPIQNIGAYGVELKDTFVNCEAIHITTGALHTFTKTDCNFGYRNSIFKTTAKGQYIITKVTFELSTSEHQLNTGYGAIENELQLQHISKPTIREVSNAIMTIRQSKLPDPKVLGNSGSFFKNPVITTSAFAKLQNAYPKIPSYPIDASCIKIPAGWLVEQVGFKGKRFGDAGVHDKQALVIVNHGNATGTELLELSITIQETVKAQFDIALETEVNIF